jgi:hypothetical protein
MIRRITPLRMLALFSAAVILSAAECPVDDITTPSDPPTPADPTPTSLVIVSGNNQTATVGQALTNPLIVRVDDQSSNAMSGITVSFAVTQGGGSVGTASVATGSDGQAQTPWTLGTAAGQQQVDATVTDITNPTTFAAMADADVPASVSLNGGDGQNVLEGTVVPTPLSVLVRDQFNNPVPDVQVTFAVTAGTGTLTGAVAMTDASGIATLGSWTVGAGANSLSATVSGTGIAGNPVSFSATGEITLFDIEIRFSTGTTPNAAEQQAYSNAVSKWQSLLVGELASQSVVFADTGRCGGALRPAMNENVDDLVIYVEFQDIDGPFGVLGQAGPCVVRGAGGLPALGGMLFDNADLLRLDTDGQLESVILHEMGHVLGFGTLWGNLNLVQDLSDTTAGGTVGNDTYFTGALALAAFDSIGGTGGHWRESVFGTELMSPSLDNGVANPLGVVSVESMGDMGYQVRPAAADTYVLPSAMPALVSGPGSMIRLDGDIWDGPIMVVDEMGSVLRVIRPRGNVRR